MSSPRAFPRVSGANLRWALKHVVAVLAYRCGLLWLFAKARDISGHSAIRILAYHGISDSPQYLEMFMKVDLFESQMRYLREHCDVISLQEAAQIIASGRRPRRNTVVITADDGYRDNYTSMFPILKRYRLPATVYLATAYVDDDRPTFVYMLMLGIDRTSKPTLDLCDLGLGSFDLRTAAAKELAIRSIDRQVRTRAASDRRSIARTIAARLDLADDDRLFRSRMLSWDQIREMNESGIEFGAHTATHPVLTAIAANEAAFEIRTSRQRIEDMLGKPCSSFAYPYGGPEDLDDQVVELVRSESFSNAVVLQAIAHSPAGMYRLGRTMVSTPMVSSIFGRYSQSLFACEVSGFFDWLLRR